MSKSWTVGVAPLLVAASAAPASVVGAAARACATGAATILVRVNGFKKPSGTVQAAVYRSGFSLRLVNG